MHIVSIINYKGGVGKTTVTANLAGELAWRGHNILMIDLDPQASLTFSFIRPEVWQEQFAAARTIKSWFDSLSTDAPVGLDSLIFTPPAIARHMHGRGRLDLIASHLGLINVDLELATELGGASLNQVKRNYLRVHRRLLDGLRGLDANTYDIVLIDCPPNFNIVTKNAIVASDFVLIPAKPDYLSTLGIDYLQRSLNQLISDFNEYARLGGDNADVIHPRVLGVVFTMVQEMSQQPIAALRPYIAQTRRLDIPVFDKYIKENKTLFADAPRDGLPVVLTKMSNSTHKAVQEGIEGVVSEFEAKLREEA